MESPLTNLKDPVSVDEAALLLALSPQAVRELLDTGNLKGSRVGTDWRTTREFLSDYAATFTVQGAPISRTGSIKPPMRVLSFFSGAMGLDLGLEAAGMETILACEFDKASRQTIEHNKPNIPVLGNIWNYSASKIREIAGLSPTEEIDVMAGGPPCQAFSTAGARRSFEDIRGNVFLHYIALIKELQPRYAVIENVRGLLSAPLRHRPHSERGPNFPDLEEAEQPGRALDFIVALLREAGYGVSFNLYNSANYGSAQVRERVVLICSRDGQRVPFLPPTHSNNTDFNLKSWRTFREVTADLPLDMATHIDFPEKRLRYYRLLEPGQYWKHLPVDLQKEALGKSFYSGGGKTGFLRRLAWDKPSPTVVTHPAMPATDLAHPELDRPLSIEEYKRIQDFPDSWEVQGKLLDQYKQIGNAVPVLLGKAIGSAIVAHDSGERWNELEGFPYSRYRNTSDHDRVRDPVDFELIKSQLFTSSE